MCRTGPHERTALEHDPYGAHGMLAVVPVAACLAEGSRGAKRRREVGSAASTPTALARHHRDAGGPLSGRGGSPVRKESDRFSRIPRSSRGGTNRMSRLGAGTASVPVSGTRATPACSIGASTVRYPSLISIVSTCRTKRKATRLKRVLFAAVAAAAALGHGNPVLPTKTEWLNWELAGADQFVHADPAPTVGPQRFRGRGGP
jgi:hypothetical protein